MEAMEGHVFEQTKTLKLIKGVGSKLNNLPCELDTMMSLLDEYWQKFKTTHFEILKLTAVTHRRDYFKEDIFSQGEAAYIQIKTSFANTLNNRIWQKNAVCVTETYDLIMRTAAGIKTLPKSRITRGYVEATMSTLNEHWEIFKPAYLEIVKLASALKNMEDYYYYLKKIYSCGEKEYITVKAKLIDMLDELNKPKVVYRPDNICSDEVNKPKMDNSQFSGNNSEGNTLRDIYGTLIQDKPTLNNLQNVTQDDHLLKPLQTSKENHGNAEDPEKKTWTFHNLQINNILYTIFTSQKEMQQPTSISIKELFDTTQHLMNVLTKLSDMSNLDPILTHVLSNKLDKESHEEWQEVKALDRDVGQQPTLKSLHDFLGARYMVLKIGNYTQTNNEAATEFETQQDVNVNSTVRAGQESPSRARYDLEPSSDLWVLSSPSQRFCYHCSVWGHYAHECEYGYE